MAWPAEPVPGNMTPLGVVADMALLTLEADALPYPGARSLIE